MFPYRERCETTETGIYYEKLYLKKMCGTIIIYLS